MRGILSAVIAGLALAAFTGAASGREDHFRVGTTEPVAGNPAEKYAGRVIEEPRSYSAEEPRRCRRARRRGVDRFVRWLDRNTRRGSPGSRYRCERLGGEFYSFHSEGRALDFSLDHSRSVERRQATRLLRLLLAEDSTGEPAALARRMGIFEIIWACGYWAQGMPDFERYFLCDGSARGRARKTIEHRDHIHFSFTRAGAAGRTSFWKRVSEVPVDPSPGPDAPQPEPGSEPPPEGGADPAPPHEAPAAAG